MEKEKNTHSIFAELRSTRSKHINKFITAHLNINSIRNKFCEIHELLLDKIVDLLFISETKLDSTFRDGLFDIPGYKLQRRDRTSSGGGIAAFIRSDIPARRRKDLEHELIESIYFEVILNKTKWIISCVYRPPNMSDSQFFNCLTPNVDKLITQYDNVMLLGDFNYDLLQKEKGKPLMDFIELFDFKNLIQSATCFMKNCTPSLLDVILTNSKPLCMKTMNFATGISDCHNMISTVINNTIPKNQKIKISYRSFRNLDINSLNIDLSSIVVPTPDSIQCSEENVNKVYETFEQDIQQIFDKHIPIKQMYRKSKQLPYMNRELRKARYNKKNVL